jgi:hypothetical protein
MATSSPHPGTAPTPIDQRTPGNFTTPRRHHDGMDPITISCDDCSMRHTEVCHDCIVTFVCDRSAAEPVVVDLPTLGALRRLSAAGLVPALRHRRVG